MYRFYCFVQGSLAFKFADLSPLPHDLQHEAFDLCVISLRTGPAFRRRKCCNVIEFSVVKEQIHACGDHSFDQSSKAFRRRQVFYIDRLLHSRDDFCQTICADGFTDRLLGIKKFVDVGLGKPNGPSQVGNRGFAVAVLTEVFVGRRNNLVSNVVIGWATGLGEAEDIDG